MFNRMIRLLFFLCVLPLLMLCCGGVDQTAIRQQFESNIKPDPFYFTLPRYRIDHLLHRVSIVGSGEGKDGITSAVASVFMRRSENIQLIEPSNLNSVLKGKALQYGTGLSNEESQAISQLLQVDHLVFFDEEVTPHRFYNLGGRQSCTIRLKIINTRDGGITFQTYQTWGVSLPDPRPAYSFISERPSEQVRNPCLSLLVNELNYALGLAALGAWSDRSVSGAVIGAIMEGSPCDKAGIKKGDRILKINDSEIHSFNDVATAIRAANQGDTQKFRMERAGRIYDFEVKYPVVPKAPVEEENEPKIILKPI